jgi:hypothetical protein
VTDSERDMYTFWKGLDVDFGIDEIMDKVREAANEKIIDVLHEAKREMGAEGRDIQIKERPSLVRRGDKYDLAGVTCPSEEIKEKFLGVVHRKLR